MDRNGAEAMKVTVNPGGIAGHVQAIPSKSNLHRLLICAALADRATVIRSAPTEAVDIHATISCLAALGAEITRREDGFNVIPLNRSKIPANCVLPCAESGSTLRFMLPVACALGANAEFHMHGRLPQRPLAPLDGLLTAHGIELSFPKLDVLRATGQLTPGRFSLPGNVSSQFISGLLMALPLLAGDSEIAVEGVVESMDYITMTTDTLGVFGQAPGFDGGVYRITSGRPFAGPGTVAAEGDWSNGAFWLCAGAMPGGDITQSGLRPDSAQGDREVCNILARMGADIHWGEDGLRVSENTRRGTEIDARAIPDLIPVLAAVAAVSEGTTVVRNAARLRLKESDRLASTAQVLNSLGARVTEDADGLRIEGVPKLRGGVVDSWGDHRIAMMAAVASAACAEPVTITGAQAVNKSYPAFWDVLRQLGKAVQVEAGESGA